MSHCQDLVPENWGIEVKEPEDLVFLGRMAIQGMIVHWLKKVGATIEEDEKEKQWDRLQKLAALVGEAKNKPPLPVARPPKDWFKQNQQIKVYIGQLEQCPLETPFVQAKVESLRGNGERIRVMFNELECPISQKIYQLSRPEIMHSWEYDYLRNNLEYAKFWTNQACRNAIKGFIPEEFLYDLSVEQ